MKHYLELEGADDEKIRVSASSYSSDDIFNGAPPRLKIGKSLYDISAIGCLSVTVNLPEDEGLPSERPLPCALVQGQHKLARFDALPAGVLAGDNSLELHTQSGLDLEDLARRNALALAGRIAGLQKQRRQEAVPAEWKQMCAEMLDHIGTGRNFIEKHIAPYEDEITTSEKRRLAESFERTAEPDWDRFHHWGNRLFESFRHDEEANQQVKRYTERVLTSELVGGANWNRSYYKPLGYPGDFQIMNYFYGVEPTGDTVYGRYLHMLGQISGRSVVNRMKFVRAVIEDLPRYNPYTDQYHLMSIGAGPAREISTFLEDAAPSEKGYSFTLVDQEITAIEYAINRAYASLKGGMPNVVISGMNTSFTKMLRPGATFRHIPPQDLIYSTGLLDYVPDNIARSMMAKLYDFLKPGGRIIIGNIADVETSRYWIMEHILDWTILIRTRQAMADMAGRCAGAEVDVEIDESGTVYMLTVTKPD